ncbi:precorrin-8X methylmutase [Pleurocapsa sp. FMAR1]|uniref:precorrin-8X methylmutase n=1 Tax=Pleurocapsa sp. FMAR1 TaxID=3040204 RepID=UPI0029C6CD4B|nr:precorrin-8X methylmutase [Pleurocapsa sp. FMAR1]
MNPHFTEASSLAAIDRQVNGNNQNISPAQYEIIRQVIYHTADFEYISLLKFSEDALSKGAASLKVSTPIVVDVPEIQVSIVPELQKTFYNPVYCCATINSETRNDKSQIASGLEALARQHPQGIFIIGQSEIALTTLINLIESKTINPSLAIATAPVFTKPERKKFSGSSFPRIYVDGSKGSATVASAILNSLVDLTWRAYGQDK